MGPINAPPLGERLRAARRELVGIEGCTVIRDVQWHVGKQRWWLELELTHAHRPPHFTDRTRWCLIVADGYPYGEIRMAPAKDGGLTATFPHQARNDPGDREAPWRSGDICVVHPTRPLGRFAELVPPPEVHERLAWYVTRTLEWLEHAARDALLQQGDPFELPSYAEPSSGRNLEVVVQEDSDSLVRWQQTDVRVGLFEAVVTEVGTRRLAVVRAFRDLEGRPIWELPGLNLRGTRGHTLVRGYWTRLARPPSLDPWQAPRTWKELAAAVAAGGDEPDVVFEKIRPGRLGSGARLLLLGSPIPRRFGEPPAQLAWQASWMPRLGLPSRKARRAHRAVSLAELMSLRTGGAARVQWLSVANWAAERLEGRGRLARSIRDSEVVLLGAGALGSLVGELLVRGGVHRLTVIDHDRLDVGNLVRHTLLAEDLYVAKAAALARRLNGASPHAQVLGVDTRVPSLDARTAMNRADVIIDCTAEDDVLRALAAESFSEPKRWISAAVASQARSLFIFMAKGRSFPADEFFVSMDPYSAAAVDAEMTWEGPGCWSPLFPARMDQIAILAALVVERVQAIVELPLDRTSFEVFTRHVGSDGMFEKLEADRTVPRG